MTNLTNVFGDTSCNKKSSVEDSDFTMVVHVRNFGKMESADIDISKFTVFVGENNSGKTYLMQLIYGLIKALAGIKNVGNYVNNFPQIVNAFNFDVVLSIVNAWITENKDYIVQSTFGDSIPIEAITLDIDGNIPEYSIAGHPKKYTCTGTERLMHSSSHIVDFCINGVPRGQIAVCDTSGEYQAVAMLQGIITHVLSGSYAEWNNPVIFFPAFRSGLLSLRQLLPASPDNTPVISGMTAPVYDFIQFVQNYQYGPSSNDVEILKFINSCLVYCPIENYNIDG